MVLLLTVMASAGIDRSATGAEWFAGFRYTARARTSQLPCASCAAAGRAAVAPSRAARQAGASFLGMGSPVTAGAQGRQLEGSLPPGTAASLDLSQARRAGARERALP
ncbi:hypothetical protein D3C72_1672290 [compost metagenome]